MTRKNYCSKLDSSTSTNKVVSELSKRQSRRRGRRLQARRRSRGLLQGDKGDRELLLVEVVVVGVRGSRGDVLLDLHSHVCVVASRPYAHLHALHV